MVFCKVGYHVSFLSKEESWNSLLEVPFSMIPNCDVGLLAAVVCLAN